MIWGTTTQGSGWLPWKQFRSRSLKTKGKQPLGPKSGLRSPSRSPSPHRPLLIKGRIRSKFSLINPDSLSQILAQEPLPQAIEKLQVHLPIAIRQDLNPSLLPRLPTRAISVNSKPWKPAGNQSYWEVRGEDRKGWPETEKRTQRTRTALSYEIWEDRDKEGKSRTFDISEWSNDGESAHESDL